MTEKGFNFEVNANGVMNTVFRESWQEYCTVTVEDVELLGIKATI